MAESIEIVYRDRNVDWNFADLKDNCIMIDKNLLKYPKAHEYIVNHELKHLEIGDNLFRQIVYEFRNDLFIHFSSDPVAVEVRRYIDENNQVLDTDSLDLFRIVWMMFLQPFAELRKFFVDRLSLE